MAKAYGFNQKDSGRVARAVQAHETRNMRQSRKRGMRHSFAPQWMLAKVVSFEEGEEDGDESLFTISVQSPDPEEDNLEFQDFVGADLSEVKAEAIKGINSLTEGAHVLAKFSHYTSSDELRFMIMPHLPYTMIRVDVSEESGDAGGKTSAPSYKYNVELAGTERVIAESAEPEMARPDGAHDSGTIGFGYFDEEGNFNLSWVDEVPQTTECE